MKTNGGFLVTKIKQLGDRIFDRFYRKYLSRLKGRGTCIYVPTCSEYAIEALEKHGVVKGSLLAIFRILRCNPFSKGGYDPVPEVRKGKRCKK